MNSETGLRFRVLRYLATQVCRFAWLIVVAGFLLAIGSVLLACYGSARLAINKLTFSGNPNELLRADAAFHRYYLQYTREFRAEEDYTIVIAGSDFERNRQCVEFIADRLKTQPDLFRRIFYRTGIAELMDRGLLFEEIPQLKEIDEGIDNFIGLMGKDNLNLDLNSLLAVAATRFDLKNLRKKENQAGLDSFAEEFVKTLTILADRLEEKNAKKPVRFGNFIAQNVKNTDLERARDEHEYLTLKEGQIFLIQVPSPNAEASLGDHDYIIRPLKAVLQEARDRYPELEIGLTGEPALSEDQAAVMNHDVTYASIATFILIALLFWFSFHEFSRPALALVTLLVAVCWTIGFTTLVVGRLNILSMAFIPMILGLGIDFGIQILGRYEEELPKTGDVITALAQTLMHTGNAIITGASTTAVAFFTMCFNQFSGLAEMGIIGGAGIILCVMANLSLLPAFLALKDRRREAQSVPQSQQYGVTKVRLFDRIVLDHAWMIIAIAVGVTGISLYASLRYTGAWFDYNLLNLQNQHLESVRFERKLLKSEDSRSIVFAASICNDVKEAAAKVAAFKKLPAVHSVASLTEMVPQNQEEKIAIISRIKRKLENVKLPKSGVKVNVPENIRVLRSLKASCERIQQLARKSPSKTQRKEALEFFGRLISAMDRALKVLEPMSQDKAEQILTSYQTQLFSELHKNLNWLKSQKVDRPITEKDVPQALRERYVGRTGKILIEIFSRNDIWERAPLVDFVTQLRTVDPRVTGTPVQNYEYIELLKVSYIDAGKYALAAVVLLIVLHFRTPRYIVPTLLPLALAIIWTLGLMVWIRLPFNPANIITLPLVIGIGVAYGVYTVDRYRENRSPAIFSTSTGKAILLSALTTIFGFGSIAFASDPGISGLGVLMTIGVTMCLITSLYVCPALLHLIKRRRIEVV